MTSISSVFNTIHRLAIIDNNRCKPTQCQRECEKKCPVNSQGRKCIDIEDIVTIKSKAKISETMCIGCGLCEKACPFKAIKIVNIPTELTRDVIHRYGANGFRLYRLPLIKTNQVMGILGPNGIGKSTMVKILIGDIVPNFETTELTDKQLLMKIKTFGNNIQQYFKSLRSSTPIKIAVKHQDMQYYVDNDPEYAHLSGGEQQLRVCMKVANTDADIYIFDEPTNYLDVKQRIAMAERIQLLRNENKYVLVIDHDISFLDYACDTISLMYGHSGAYGVFSKPYTTAEAINAYLDGYLPSENVRFRTEPFKYTRNLENIDVALLETSGDLSYPSMKIEHPGFKLTTNAGVVPIDLSVTVILGENGTGKTSFLKQIHEQLGLTMSVKSQYPKFEKLKGCTVQMLLLHHASNAITDPMFKSDVMNLLDMPQIMDKQVSTLSGGEQQRLAIVCCLAKESDLYILDEPSAMLDIEQRVNLSKVIKRYVFHNRKAVFIVEHDISVALAVSKEINAQVIVFDRNKTDSEVLSTASTPMNMYDGMNAFLRKLNVTFRRNEKFKRHRINKLNSIKDIEQKKSGRFFMD